MSEKISAKELSDSITETRERVVLVRNAASSMGVTSVVTRANGILEGLDHALGLIEGLSNGA